MQDILCFILSQWKLFAALCTAIWAVWVFILTRRRELAWKRTEFLFKQCELLDKDSDMVEISKILEGRHQTITVDDIFASSSKLNKDIIKIKKRKVEKHYPVSEDVDYQLVSTKY